MTLGSGRFGITMNSRSKAFRSWYVVLVLGLLLPFQPSIEAQEWEAPVEKYVEENNQIRRDKFDLVLPEIMRERGIDMWIVSDNVRKGAALNSIQIAEILVNQLM